MNLLDIENLASLAFPTVSTVTGALLNALLIAMVVADTPAQLENRCAGCTKVQLERRCS